MSYRTARATAAGLGSAHGGTHHWWMQRLSSIALIPLSIFFVLPFGQGLGSSHADVLAIYQTPFNALIGVLFAVVTFQHLQQGLQVVIEDYVHDKGWRVGLLVGNWALCGAAGLAGAFAILKIAFGA